MTGLYRTFDRQGWPVDIAAQSFDTWWPRDPEWFTWWPPFEGPSWIISHVRGLR